MKENNKIIGNELKKETKKQEKKKTRKGVERVDVTWIVRLIQDLDSLT